MVTFAYLIIVLNKYLNLFKTYCYHQANNKAIELSNQGKYSEAIPIAQQALEFAQLLYDGDHPNIAAAVNNLAFIYHKQGQLSQAEYFYQISLNIIRRIFPVGEGVFGLRRAFAVAGCKTLVMSLWSVPTKASILLMDKFLYLLKSGCGRYDALTRSQNYIRSVTIQELKQFPLGQEILEELKTEMKPFLDLYISVNIFVKNLPDLGLTEEN